MKLLITVVVALAAATAIILLMIFDARASDALSYVPSGVMPMCLINVRQFRDCAP